MILDDIHKKLEEINDRVFYGMVDESVNNTIWEYIVFNRLNTHPSQNRTSYSDYFEVHYISEEYIAENLDIEIITKMLEIDGMRLASEPLTYSYTLKPNTNTVIEILTLRFVRVRK